ncbi:MAG: hypothetical protein CVU56_15290 [Deltaproteobacteria bacterium HGW-Deltaproteobacteria-14]|jgi:hypothetical protein|nr:MAG: hypothetical protein CVU56_15290 [Deltaproteobacteria bacterium HGW-Deltaproteobacteria-14]
MRKLLCLSLVALLGTPFVACGDSGTSSTTDTVGADTLVPSDTTGDTSTGTDTVTGDTGTVTDTGTATDTGTTTDTGTATDTVVVTCTDDNLAGTEAAPAALPGVLDGNPTFHICAGVADVFSFTATAGEIVKINLISDVADLTADTTPGVDDIDMYLYEGSIAEANIVAAGATAAAIEQIAYTVETTGTFYLVVEDYEGSAIDYTLTFAKATACKTDADCTGGDICYIGIDDENFVIAQECKAYTAPTCGQTTAEDTTSAHSDSTAVAFSSVATDGAFTGSICGSDVDVFKFTLDAGDSVVGSLSSPVTGNGLLLGTWVGPGGAILDNVQIGADATSGDFTSLFINKAGTYYLYLDYLADGSPTADLAYTITATTASPCLLDADCTGGAVCGMATTTGPISVCVPYKADVCGTDDDNSQTKATELTSGTAVTTEVVCDTGNDWYKITVANGKNDLTAVLTWTGDADLDLYLLSATGVPYGAGWFGEGTETIAGKNLPDGTYFFIIDQYTTDGSGTAGVAYSFTVTATASAANCADDAACVVGGTFTSADGGDPTVGLTCNTTSGVCAPGITAGINSVSPGGACFDGRGVAYIGQCSNGGLCADICLTLCDTNAQADCDSDWGGTGIAYCAQGLFSIGDLCLPNCDSPTATTHLWGDADCSDFGFDGCDGSTNQCAIPQ